MVKETNNRQRVIRVKLDFTEDKNNTVYNRLRELSWQEMRYRNLNLRARWAEAKNLKVDPKNDIPHDVTKWIRADEKMDLSGSAYSAAEQEVAAIWKRHGKRILAGAALPEWRENAALSIRGHKNQRESGIRLRLDDQGKFIAQLQVQADKCPGGSWIEVPLALGTEKDYQAALLEKMVTWEVPISKATLKISPMKHQITLRMSYAETVPLPVMGERVATLGPIGQRGTKEQPVFALFLRAELQTRDYTGRLYTLLDRKENWDLIRRRVCAQIGRTRGAARKKRKLLSRLSWDDWLDTFLHTWTADVIGWLKTQGVGRLIVTGLEYADWPQYKFVERLRYKAESAGIILQTEMELAPESSERAVKAEIGKRRRSATKLGKAIREIGAQVA